MDYLPTLFFARGDQRGRLFYARVEASICVA
jgi:hypothetical protein